MSSFLRRVRTASGATAVQIVAKKGRRNEVLEYLGSAHDEAELAALVRAGQIDALLPGGLDQLVSDRRHVRRWRKDPDRMSTRPPSSIVIVVSVFIA